MYKHTGTTVKKQGDRKRQGSRERDEGRHIPTEIDIQTESEANR